MTNSVKVRPKPVASHHRNVTMVLTEGRSVFE